MFGKSKRYRVRDVIEPLLDEERFAEPEMLARITERQKVQGSTVAQQETLAPEAISSISSGLSIVGSLPFRATRVKISCSSLRTRLVECLERRTDLESLF